MFTILIPIAGKGQRFIDEGYKLPKPLIDVGGKPMIQRVVESLNIDGRYVYCVLKEHQEKYGICDLLKKITPWCHFVMIDKTTEGAACTCLLAQDYIENDEPLIIANSDQIVEFNRPLFIGNTIYYGGCILTFPAFDKKWSFVLTDKNNNVKYVAEKEIISTQANCGIYSFNKGLDFIMAAESMIEKNIRVNGEFYIAPVYNQMLDPKQGYTFKAQMVEEMFPCGTPTDLEATLKVMVMKQFMKDGSLILNKDMK